MTVIYIKAKHHAGVVTGVELTVAVYDGGLRKVARDATFPKNLTSILIYTINALILWRRTSRRQ